MIEAKISKDGGFFTMELEGHANFAPTGQDLVCAAVSALCHGLCDYINLLELRGLCRESPVTELSRGRCKIAVRTEPQARERTAGAFELAAMILALLEEHYPKHIKISHMKEK